MTVKLDTMYRIDAPPSKHHDRIVRVIDTSEVSPGCQAAFYECLTDGDRGMCCTSALRRIGPCQIVGAEKELSG